MDREIIRRPLDGVDLPRPLRASELREQRVQQLLESCEQQILQQIIGPFGLTPAMFDDKDGGNVTTQHNAKKDVFAKDEEGYDKKGDYKYDTARREKKKEAVVAGDMNSTEFTDALTGNKEPTRRLNENNKQQMNAELDHLVPTKMAHSQGGWMLTPEERTALASDPDNLNYTTHKTNRSKGSRDPRDFLTEENGFDPERVDPLIDKAEEAIEKHLPTTTERVTYHAKELAAASVKDGAKQGIKKALGVLLHEFINHSFIEVKRILNGDAGQMNLLDELGASLQRVVQRVISKMRTVFEALISGGVEGVVSNLLTFLINSFITTAAKLVTLIRESMHSLWRAIKLVLNPPPHMSSLEVAREATKIIAAAVVVGLGMMVEESIKAFILTIPFLKPIVDLVAPAVTAIVTGLTTALVIYGLDRLFDAMASKGTELLEAMHANSQYQAQAIGLLENWLKEQLDTSRLYAKAAEEYERIQQSMSASNFNIALAATSAEETTQAFQATIDTVATQYERKHKLQQQLDAILLGSSNPKIA